MSLRPNVISMSLDHNLQKMMISLNQELHEKYDMKNKEVKKLRRDLERHERSQSSLEKRLIRGQLKRKKE